MPYKVVFKAWWALNKATPHPINGFKSYRDRKLIDPADEIVSMMDGLMCGINHKAERNEYDITTI